MISISKEIEATLAAPSDAPEPRVSPGSTRYRVALPLIVFYNCGREAEAEVPDRDVRVSARQVTRSLRHPMSLWTKS